jgi:hypothetical protein
LLAAFRMARRRRRTSAARGQLLLSLAVIAPLWLLAAPFPARAQATADSPLEAQSLPATAVPGEKSPKRGCIPGHQIGCPCGGGKKGAQQCKPDGSGFGPCTACGGNDEKETGAEPAEAGKKQGRKGSGEPAAADASGDGEAPADSGYLASRMALYLTAGGAVDKPAVAASAAGRYRLDDRWLVGLDAEWNPWASYELMRFRPGCLNVYSTLVRRYPVSRAIALRTTIHLGLSFLLFDLVGAPSGSVGPVVGASLLGLEIRLHRLWRLVIEPADVFVPVPHLTGVPLIYQQYRLTVGVQFGFGDR